MGSHVVVNNENIPLVIHYYKDCDDDYGYYNTPNTSGVDETTVAINPRINKQHQL